MANPFLFSSGATLTAAQLNAVGNKDDVTWSPTVNWSGTVALSKYAQINDVIIIQFRFTLDATPSGTFEITSAPVASAYNIAGISGNGSAVDTSADDVYAIAPNVQSSNKIRLTTVSHNDFATVTSSAPFSWASGDSIRFLMVYFA